MLLLLLFTTTNKWERLTWIRQIYKTKSEQITKYIILITPFSENCSLLYKGKKMTTVINIPVFLLYFWKNVFQMSEKKGETLKIPSVSTVRQRMATGELVVIFFEYSPPLAKNLLVPTRTQRYPSPMVFFP